MSTTREYLEFVYLRSFVRDAKGLLSEDDERWIEQALIENPEAGATVSGTGGVRKLRVALEGRGKSGGARVIYFWLGVKGRIYLIAAYGKNEKANISAAEKRAIKQAVERLEAER